MADGLQSAIVAFSIRFRGVVIALGVAVMIYGAYMVSRAQYDVFPEFAPPQVSVQTEAPGLAAGQVEILITQPLENILNGSPGLRSIRSTSIQGLSVITITFDPGSNVYLDRQFVTERLSVAATQLPAGTPAPAITPLTSATSIALIAGMTSRSRSLMDIRTVADWTVRPRLLAVPGVAKVVVFGGDVRSLQVQVHPDQLIRFGIGINDVLTAAQRATGVRGAGFIDTANQRITLQTEGQSLTPEELGRVVLTSQGGASTTLADVADVVVAPEPAIGAATIDGQPGVQLLISEQYGANTLDVAQRADAAFAELAPALQREGIELRTDIFRPGNFIQLATANVGRSLIIGSALVIGIVFLFLFNVRTALISCVAIPLSLLTAVIVLVRSGVALNTMTLGGLAIAIGVVVDDAIIDVENIARRLRENVLLPDPRPAHRVIFDACLEVRSAVVYATFAVVLVVIPVLALSDVAGALFAPLGVAYILAVLASLGVALTVTPALATVLLAGGGLRAVEPPMIRWCKAGYGPLLRGLARHPRALIAGAVALAGAAIATLPFFGASFVPELNEGHFVVHMIAVPGTSIAESLRIGDRVIRALHQIPAVRLLAQRAGRAELGDDTYGTHYSEFELDLRPLNGDEADAVLSDIRKILAQFPGVDFAVFPFINERIEETLSGFTAPLVVNIFGNDLNALDQKAREVAQAIQRVPGATDVVVQSPPGMPQLNVNLRKSELLRWGIDPVDVLDIVRTTYGGDIIGQVFDGNRTFNVMVILNPQDRRSPVSVGNLPLRTPSGTYVRLNQIADLSETSGRYQVLHDGAQRVQTVTANVSGGDIVTFVNRVKGQIAKIEMPPGAYVAYGGAAEAEAQSQRDLIVNSLLAALGIVVLISMITRSPNNLLLVLANVPFSLIGGVFAVFALGGLLSLGSMVGFITLFGITLRNSILMISHYEHLVTIEGAPWNLETAIRGASDRLAPILMTTVVTALGVLPLAIQMDEAGNEIEGAMAIVILGGLLTSMVLNLLVLPTLALRYGKFSSGENALTTMADARR